MRLSHIDARMPYGHLVRYLALELPGGVLAPNQNPAEFVHDSFVLETKQGERTPFADLGDRFIADFGDRASCVSPPT